MKAAAENATLSVICANTCFGGIDEDGSTSRWDALVKYLLGRQPDVLLLQEMRGATPAGTEAHVAATAEALGMAPAALGPPAPGAPIGAEHHTAILTGPGLEVVPHDRPQVHPWDALPWAEVQVQVPGLPFPVWFYSVHLPPSRHTGQMLHAEKLAATVARRARKGQLAFVGGDFNCLAPADGYSQEQLAAMPQDVWPARVRVLPDGSLEPKLGVHGELSAAGLADIAAGLPPGLRTPPALTPSGTAGGRVDRGYAHAALAAAVTGCRQVRLRDATDHDIVEFTVRLAKAA